MPIHTMSPERAEQMRAAGLTPGAIHITAAGMEITLERTAR